MTVRLHNLLTPGRTWMLFVLFRAAGGSQAFQPLVVKISITKTIQIFLHFIPPMEKKNSLALQVLNRKTVQKCIELQYVGVLLLLHTGRKEKFS